MKVAALALGVFVAGCASAAPGANEVSAAATPRGGTVLDGVYTADQATRGQQEFQQSCASCHSINEFAGPIFQRIWAGRPVGEMYEFISTMMPESDPGGLTARQYADVIAYFLRQNQYPEGGTELPADATALRAILFAQPAG